MDTQTCNQLTDFIRSIADNYLSGVYVRSKYRDVILPMTLIRRLDALLEDTKDTVLKTKKTLDDAGIVNQTEALCTAAGQPFYNASPFRLKNLTDCADQQNLKADFTEYLNGFSDNVQEILKNFNFHSQIDTMFEADILEAVITEFVSPSVNFKPYTVPDESGFFRLPALDNPTMDTVFEELIRCFSEDNRETAAHFTPRDVVELMADLLFQPVADKMIDGTYSIYDGASGTGGMLTVSKEQLINIAEQNGKNVSVHLFGQESNPETYAIHCAHMLLKGEDCETAHIACGSTLSDDRFPNHRFDFMLSHPPCSKSWKKDADKLGGKKEITDSRFVTAFADESEFNMLPRASDGQLLFLLNNVSKIQEQTELGSRIVEVHNGSSLVTGEDGQGESNARRYLIERDLVEAIIALPGNTCYNTTGTFIWVLSNRKEPKRRGKIQLIDATTCQSPLRKNWGRKKCELTDKSRKQILKLFLDFEENRYSKIFNNGAFGYWKVIVLRPLRICMRVTKETVAQVGHILETNGVFDNESDGTIADFFRLIRENVAGMPRRFTIAKTIPQQLGSAVMQSAFDILCTLIRDEPYWDMAEFEKIFNEKIKEDIKLKEIIKEAGFPFIYGKDITYQSICNLGFFYPMEEKNPAAKVTVNEKGWITADHALTEIRKIPLDYPGGIDAFIEKEIMPHTPDAWVNRNTAIIGYKIDFVKQFYKTQLQEMAEIVADIRHMSIKTQGEGNNT